MSWLQLAQKTAIVTGAASGIGAAVTKALLSEGCRVVLADRDAAAMEQAVATFQRDTSPSFSSSSDHIFVECDVTNSSQVQSLIQQADHFAESFGGTTPMATLMVNCAGITRDNWVSKMTMKEWEDVIDVNLKGTYLTCRFFLGQARMGKTLLVPSSSPEMVSSIVNVGSVVSEFGNLGQANYAASKGGVLGLTRALAKETARRNVRVNCILPGFIDTPMANAVPDHVKADVILPKIPMGRFGKSEEVANTVAFLLSPRSSYITGEAVSVSGMISL